MQSWLDDPLRAGGVGGELGSGTDGSTLQPAAAVRTPAAQTHLDASRAPRALEGADHRGRRLGREVDVTAFAARAQFQHPASLVAGQLGCPYPRRDRDERMAAWIARQPLPAEWSGWVKPGTER